MVYDFQQRKYFRYQTKSAAPMSLFFYCCKKENMKTMIILVKLFFTQIRSQNYLIGDNSSGLFALRRVSIKAYNNFMIENRPHRHRNENLKTQVSFSGKTGEVQLGKLVRLPYIRKISTNTNNGHLQRRSLENKDNRISRKSNKELHLFEQTQFNMLTLQQAELCEGSNKEKDLFPKINLHNNPILIRDKSIESLQHSLGHRPQKSLSKLQFSDRLRDFKVGPVIGKGTYSIVRAGKTRDSKKVAIKTYLKSSLSNEDRKKNLQHQIEVLSMLQHPSILSYVDTIESQESIGIVTQLLENRSLADYARFECFNAIKQEIAKFMVKHLVKAISYCHSKDIVHRDIKMENILINKEYKPKLIDFGFSRQLPKENFILYDYCGTSNYIAPEIIQREGYYGKPADIWSLGILIFKMTTGGFPFKYYTDKNSTLKGMKSDLKIPNTLSPQLSSLLSQILTFDYRKRPSAEEILASQWLTTK